MVRGLSAEEALAQLRFLPKRSAGPVFKLLQSAIANAEHNFSLSSEGLKIETLKVDGGPVFKRSRPSSRGRTAPRSKKTSHITLILEGDRKTNKSAKETDKDNLKIGLSPSFSLTGAEKFTQAFSIPGAAASILYKHDNNLTVSLNGGYNPVDGPHGFGGAAMKF